MLRCFQRTHNIRLHPTPPARVSRTVGRTTTETEGKESRSVGGAHLVIWRAASDTNIASEVLLCTTVSG